MPTKKPTINQKYNNVTSVGSGAISVDQARPDATLDGVGEYQYVTLTNPLPFKFIGQVAQSRNVNAPVRIVDGESKGVDENSLRAAGLDLRNPDHSGKAHVTAKIEIEPGQSINIRGDEAQVIVRQLVNEILAYRGETMRRGAPAYRKEVEKQIILSIRSVDELMGSQPDQRAELNEAIKNAPVEKEEKAFPTVKQEA
jgi:hypothetical protein